LTRAQLAHRLLRPEGVDLLGAVAGRHKVELLGFAREAGPAEADRLDALFASAGDATKKPDNRQATDLRAPLSHALENSGMDQSKVLGVVILTDGQHNWGPSPVAKAAELGEQDLPVFPVALGSRQSPPDIDVIAVAAPPAALK